MQLMVLIIMQVQGSFYLKGKEIVTVPCPRASGEWLKYLRRFLHHVTDPEEKLVMLFSARRRRSNLVRKGLRPTSLQIRSTPCAGP